MKVAIVTDSNSGIFIEEGKRLKVAVIPMPVILGGKEYFEGIDLNEECFYQHLYTGAKVLTSQPSGGAVIKKWEELLRQGYDEIVYIPMSSGLSSSCATAKILAEEFHGKVEVADNHRISVTQRQAVMDALKMAEKGFNAREIRINLEEHGADSMIYVGVEDFSCLKRSGRITPSAAAMASFLQIKPLFVIDGGKLDAYDKVRGSRNCKRHLIEAIRKKAEEYTLEGADYSIGIASSIFDPQKKEEWISMAKEAFKKEEVYYDPLPFSISSHVGPDSFGMGISKKIIV